MSFILGQLCSALFSTTDDFPPLAIQSSSIEPQLERATTQQIFDAIDSGDAIRVTDLFSKYHVDLTTIDDASGDTPLHRAAEKCDHEIIKILLEHVDNAPSILNTINQKGLTPLVSAAEKPNVSNIISLIQAGANTEDYYQPCAHYHSIMKEDEQHFDYDRIALISALKAANGDVTSAAIIGLQNDRDKIVYWCLEAGASAICILKESVEQRRFEKMSSLTALTLVKSLTEMMNNNYLSFEDQTILIDAIFMYGFNMYVAQFDDLFSKSTFKSNLVAHQALENKSKLTTLLQQRSFHFTDSDTQQSIFEISKYKNKSLNEKISAIKLIIDVSPKTLEAELIKSTLSNNFPVPINILNSVGLDISPRRILDIVKFNEIKITNTMFDLGILEEDVIKLLSEEKRNYAFNLNLASVALKHLVLENPKFESKEAKLTELTRWLGNHPTIVEGSKKLLADETKAERFDHVKLLMDAKVSVDDLLISLGKEGNLNHAMELIEMGANVGSVLAQMIGKIDFHIKDIEYKVAYAEKAVQIVQQTRVAQEKASLELNAALIALDTHTDPTAYTSASKVARFCENQVDLAPKRIRTALQNAELAAQAVKDAHVALAKVRRDEQPGINLLTLATALRAKALDVKRQSQRAFLNSKKAQN